MACLMCGKRAGFNRAVVDVPGGYEFGRLCRNCELDYFGRRLEGGGADAQRCLFCDREGYYAVPSFEATVVESDGKLVSENHANVTGSTPRICEYHVDLMQQFDETAYSLGPDESETDGHSAEEFP